MAENEVKDVAEEGEAPKKGKGIILIAAIGVVLIAGGVVTGMVMGKKSRALPKVEVKKKAEDPLLVSFEDLFVNIAETKATRVLKLSVVLEVSEEKLKTAIGAYADIIRDIMSESASRMTIEELEGRNGRGILKRDIKNRVNDLLRDRMEGAVVDVYFKDFLIQ